MRLVQSKLFAGSGGRIGCMFSITSGSKTHHFCADDPEVAEAWVAAVKETWLHCVSHASRTLRVGPATGQVGNGSILDLPWEVLPTPC